MFNKILINYSSVVLALMCIGINSYPDILSRYFSSRIFWRISEKLVSTALVKNLQRIKCFCPCHHSKYIHARCQMKELSRIIRYSTYVAFSHPPTFLLISARVYAQTRSCIFAIYGYRKHLRKLIRYAYAAYDACKNTK